MVVGLAALIGFADYAFRGGLGSASFQRVSPGRDGMVRLAVGSLSPLGVSFYRFLNAGNQEVRFFVARDEGGQLQVAFDANEQCAKWQRGYRHEGEWVVCNKCDKAFRIREVNAGGGGCKPIPLPFRVEGSDLVLTESDILAGWRLFR